MTVSCVSAALGMALLCVFLKFRVSKGPCAQVTVIKASVSIGFMFTAFSAVYYCAGKTALAVCVGLMFGMLGDIFLDQKFAHPDSAKVYTYAGFFAFAFDHIFYIAFLIKNFYLPGKTLYVIIPVIIAVLVAFLNILCEKLMKLRYGEYKAVTFFYGAVLFSFVTVSFSMALLSGFKNTVCIMMFISSVLFAVSDLILSGTYFGEGKSRPVDIITNHVTYYFAQYLIALSLCFMN